MKRVLIVEDERALARFVELELRHEGFEVAVAHDGREGLEKALREEWSLILLDLMLPLLSGVEVCRRIRAVTDTPIIMITARDSVIDRVTGLDSGADDYVAKPFAIEELLARMRAIFRRTEARASDVLRIRDLSVQTDSCVVQRGGEVLQLTKREYELLLTLLANKNRVMTREMLLEQVWGYEADVETNVVDVYIRYLRNTIDRTGDSSLIETVRGFGYVMRE